MDQLSRIKRCLIEKIASTFIPINEESGQLVNFSCAVDLLNPMHWLMAQSDPVKIYWSPRDDHQVIAGVGLADLFDTQRVPSPDQAIDTIEDNLTNASPKIRYYGGMCFDSGCFLDSEKEALGHYCFFVPRFEVRKEKGQSVFFFNVLATPKDDIDSITLQFLDSFDKLSFDLIVKHNTTSTSLLPAVLDRFDTPDQNTWQQQTQELIGHIQADRVKKVVLTRIACLELAAEPDPLVLLRHAGDQTVNTYDFCFQTDRGHSFIGCSPECLYRKEGDNIYSEALAGTNARSVDQEQDRKFQGELLGSQKEAQEHEYVFENIKSELEKICDHVVVAEKREILSLGYAQHLRSRFTGTLKTGLSNRDILNSLHPTAAVNGYPKAEALSLISQYEQFSRGWYAGPVGWMSCERSEFSVAIRSAHITGRGIKLFAGAGIVGASDPIREWDETEIKMAPFLSLFEASLKS